MDPLFVGAVLIRTFNALLWARVVWRIAGEDHPISRTARIMISTVIFTGFWVLAIGGFAPLFPDAGGLFRLLYTAYTAFAAIVALTLLMEKHI